ncbi:DUF6114 domain-containing protein [Micromonospora sp. URMC 106]|uniref:DUF6114 domain-containing protein n=1 Tax=Micromonospora sp. URMC 106 TaxID=3423408 RepID=UPI003F1DC998
MTTADPQPDRRGRLREAWHGFRRWRRARPFWGGLLTALAGLEIFGTTQMSLGGLTLQMGPTGFLSWLIPTILVACGLLMWSSPQQRIFYAVVASVTALFSLIGVNLGGFLVGLLLGMVGSALGFAWMPDARPAVPSEPDGERPPSTGNAGDPQAADEGVDARAIPVEAPAGGDEPATVPTAAYDGGTGAAQPAGPESAPRAPGPHDPRLYAVLPALLGLCAAVALVAPKATPVHAAPPPAPACSTRPAPTGTPSTTTTPAAPRPSPSTVGGDSGGNVITDILEGIGDLLGGGRHGDEKASPTPAVTPSARPPATGRPTRGPACGPDRPKPSRPATVEEGRPLPRIAAEPGQPLVSAVPSKLTGSKVTMTGLRFEGIVDLPTADGTLRALKFGMDQAVTDDFLLRTPGPAGRTMRFATDRLTVRGDVAFYATRFVGRLLGIKITLTPDLPLPDGLPITSPIPITFTDPAMDLAFVSSDTLTARPTLKLTLD